MKYLSLLASAVLALSFSGGAAYSSHEIVVTGKKSLGVQCREKLYAAGYIRHGKGRDRDHAVTAIAACVRNKGKI